MFAHVLPKRPTLHEASRRQAVPVLEKRIGPLVLGAGLFERHIELLGALGPERTHQLRHASALVMGKVDPMVGENELQVWNVAFERALNGGGEAQLGERL